MHPRLYTNITNMNKAIDMLDAAADNGMELLAALYPKNTNDNFFIELGFSTTPLVKAIENNQPTCVQWLVDHGANLNFSSVIDTDEDDEPVFSKTPLKLAAFLGHTECLNILITAHEKQNPQEITSLFSNALIETIDAYHTAIENHPEIIEKGFTKCAKALIKNGASLLFSDGDEMPLKIIMGGDSEPFLSLIIDMYAEKEIDDKTLLKAISFSVEREQTDYLETLLDYVSPELLKQTEEATVNTITSDQVNALNLLIEAGVEISGIILTNHKQSPTLIQLAVLTQSINCLYLLIETYQRNLNDNDLIEAAILAAKEDNLECLKVFIEHNINLNVFSNKDNNQDTPLIVAARHGNMACVEHLINRSEINITFKNAQGQNAADITEKSHPEISILIRIEQHNRDMHVLSRFPKDIHYKTILKTACTAVENNKDGTILLSLAEKLMFDCNNPKQVYVPDTLKKAAECYNQIISHPPTTFHEDIVKRVYAGLASLALADCDVINTKHSVTYKFNHHSWEEIHHLALLGQPYSTHIVQHAKQHLENKTGPHETLAAELDKMNEAGKNNLKRKHNDDASKTPSLPSHSTLYANNAKRRKIKEEATSFHSFQR